MSADVLATWDALVKCAYRSDDIPPHESELDAARTAVAALIERNAELERKTAVQMGVGDGAGQLYVYGDYESIKAAQAMALRCEALAAEVKALRAERDGLRSVVNPGEVLVEVHGLTGSGKSAVAGEIEILCKALGLDVRWENGDEEKFLTHADWTAALELYAPRVRIVEINTPRPAAIDAARASAATGGV